MERGCLHPSGLKRPGRRGRKTREVRENPPLRTAFRGPPLSRLGDRPPLQKLCRATQGHESHSSGCGHLRETGNLGTCSPLDQGWPEQGAMRFPDEVESTARSRLPLPPRKAAEIASTLVARTEVVLLAAALFIYLHKTRRSISGSLSLCTATEGLAGPDQCAPRFSEGRHNPEIAPTFLLVTRVQKMP